MSLTLACKSDHPFLFVLNIVRTLPHSDECPCSTGPQTPNHILQSCPTFDAWRCQTCPSLVDTHRKLCRPAETLAYCRLCLTHRTEDLAWPGTQKKYGLFKQSVTTGRCCNVYKSRESRNYAAGFKMYVEVVGLCWSGVHV